MFVVGEKVVYPAHGAGIIDAIEDRDILGERRGYYVLHLSLGDLRVMVPIDTVEKVGLRLISDREAFLDAARVLREDPAPWDDNWNRRYRTNMDKIKSGDICQLAEVVRNLMVRDVEKGLSTGEKKMLDNARKILYSEVILAEDNVPKEEGEFLKGILLK